MSILLTGVAGFIGMHTARRLLDRGEQVIGVDVINAYYDPALKHARLATFEAPTGSHLRSWTSPIATRCSI